MKNLRFDKKIFYCEDKPIFEFPLDISRYIPDGDRIFILIDGYRPSPPCPDNVFCINFNGDLLWRAEPRSIFPGDRYSWIDFENDKVIAQTGSGLKCTINSETGKVEQVVLTKF